jgi:hypothetical protein
MAETEVGFQEEFGISAPEIDDAIGFAARGRMKMCGRHDVVCFFHMNERSPLTAS